MRTANSFVTRAFLLQPCNTSPGVSKYGTGHGTRVTATALIRAASVGDAAQVRLLLAAGADTEVKEENFGKTAVRIAEELAHAECVQILSA